MPRLPEPGSYLPFPPIGRTRLVLSVPAFVAFLATITFAPAGDILRGGAAPGVRQSDPSIGASVAAQQQARASQQDALAKTAQSLNAVRALQAQAKAMSLRSGALNAGADPNHPGQLLPDVPNGLGAGALQLQGVPIGALSPVQSGSAGLAEVTIKQTAQQAFLNWETFNVGRDTTLTFDQSAGAANISQWIAFNRVTDPSGRPSQILGRINAGGQIYIINQNGIIFGGTSQINARSLVASSLPINDNLIQRGLLNNPDSQFLLSALPLPAGAKGTPAFTPPASFLPDNRQGDVTVQPGALISSAVSADGNGGRIFLSGANVTNAGSLVAPSGQVILAAGLQVGVDAHQSSDASLRGLDVYIGNVGTYGGTVTNSGLIETMRGSASLSGKNIFHTGAIESSTSVSLNGRVDFNASYDAVPNAIFDPAVPTTGRPWLFQSTGQIGLGAGSVMRILPEIGSAEKAVGTELALRSQINLQGRTIHLGPGAAILAPNAAVTLKAGNWAYNPAIPSSIFLTSGGQVYLDRGSSINVSGSTGVTAPLSQVILSLVLRGGELAPSPLQRSGLLRGPTLTVDLRNRGVYNGRQWIGTPLADLTGYPGLVERTVGELTAAGGTVDIAAGGSVVLQPGSTINVSGGHITYAGGTVKTSRIIADGHLIDIKNATPDRLYDGVFTGTSTELHPRWGIAATWQLPLAPTGEHYEPPTLQGAAAGSIAITAPSQALDGNLTGIISPGPRQLRATPDTSNMPQAGSLTLSFSGETQLGNTVVTHFPAPPDIIFKEANQPAAGPFSIDASDNPATLDESRRQLVYLSPQLTTRDGFGSITIHNEGGSISVPDDVTLAGRPGGTFRFFGTNIGVFGDITAPGGTIAFETLNLTPYDTAFIRSLPEEQRRLPVPNADRGIFTLGPDATLNSAGLIVDDRLNQQTAFTQPALIGGGSVSIKAYTANLHEGSVIDVSGGVIVSPLGSRTYGNGGQIVLEAGQDPNLDGLTGGTLRTGSSLRGYSGATGGSLTVLAPYIHIGGGPAAAEAFRVGPSFFSEGGFSSFSLTGLGGLDLAGAVQPAVVIAPRTRINPVAQSLVAALYPQGGGVDMRIVEKPVGLRSPVSLEFAAPGVRDGILGGTLVRGDLVMGTGSEIRTEPIASVILSGQTVSVSGSIFAPAGSITLSGAKDSTGIFGDAAQARSTVFIGPRSVLSAAGAVLLSPDAYGRRMGSVLPGGSISVSGNLLAALGAVLDVSGTSGVLDLHHAVASPLRTYSISARSGLTAPLANLAVQPVRLDSSGGDITLEGGQFLLSDATLLGRAGGPTATGGTLQVSSGRFLTPGNLGSDTETNLIVRQNGALIPGSTDLSGTGVGRIVPGRVSQGYFTADRFMAGGFDSLTLGGKVGFQGPVSLGARGFLSVADGGILSADNDVLLAAPYVALGRPFEAPTRPEDIRSPFGSAFGPTAGPGRLSVEANQLDIGALSLQNIRAASLTADHGDIRGNGTLHIAGDLTLRAAQIYPTTASAFNIIAYDRTEGGTLMPGSITVPGSGTSALPLSAGGSLGFYASRIEQNGVLRAPFGQITLGWDGTGTAPVDLIAGTSIPFPVTRNLTLGQGSITSVSAVDPMTGRGILIPYGISPDGLTWVDPRGVDITAGGLPAKSIALSGQNLTFASGATIDLRGGGDLFAYRFVEGNGGPEDILADEGRFAILPGFQSPYLPFAPYNNSTVPTKLIADSGPGYTNSRLQAGDRIFVQGSATLRAGYYTLLPARYALLPGAVLVTPQTRRPTGTWELPDGSSLVSGYVSNSLNTQRRVPVIADQFELASGTVVRARAEYESYLANAFLTEAAGRLNLGSALLPRDSGSLDFQGSQSMNLAGSVLSRSISGGRGSLIDISSPLNFMINRSGVSEASGTVTLNSDLLSSWSADSLLIGGRRSSNAEGSPAITARTLSIVVDNQGSPLTAADLILASTGTITLAPGASLASTGSSTGATSYQIAGNGTLVRVSSDPSAEVIRRGATASAAALIIGAGSSLSGGSITLDSTASTFLDPTARLSAEAYTLNSGRIGLALENPGLLPVDSGLVLTGSAFANLQGARSLTLRSYSTIDLYGGGSVGLPGLQRLTLSAGEIRGFNPAVGGIDFNAGEILLGNAPGAASFVSTPAGSLTSELRFNAGTIRLTSGNVAMNQFNQVVLNASQGLIGEGSGRFGTQGNLTILSPIVTGASGSQREILAGGNLLLTGNAATPAAVIPGLGASLNLSGARTTVDNAIMLPSGSLGLTATSGDLTINGSLQVPGMSRSFHDAIRYTDAGGIRLSATTGNVILQPGSLVNVAAHPGGGNAGSLDISVPQGQFLSNGTLSGGASSGYDNGSFSLDTAALNSTAALHADLTQAGLTNRQSLRVRTGDVLLDGSANARQYSLSADSGSITLTGLVNASGLTGGSIHLASHGNLILTSTGVLTVAGGTFDNAGKGGSIMLEAGAQRDGVAGTGSLEMRTGSMLDLSVSSHIAGSASTPGTSGWYGQFTGKLHLRAPQNAAGTDLLINPINSTVLGASAITAEGYKVYDLTAAGGTITTTVQNQIRNDGIAFLGAAGTTSANFTAMTSRLLANNAGLESVFVLTPGAELINRTGNLTLGTTTSTTVNDWDLSGYRFGAKSAAGNLTMRAAGDLVFNNTLSDGFTAFNPATNPPAANLRLWLARLTAQNPLLPVNLQSYSYQLTAGADLTAADAASVLTNPSGTSGSLILGKAGTSQDARDNTVPGGNGALTSSVIPQRWQVIRTGSGDISISTARDIQLLNQLATIYSAGTAVADPGMGGTFDVRALVLPPAGTTDLGAFQQNYVMQYAMGGGNVTLNAGRNIEHLTRNAAGQLVADSTQQLPNNWLYRRGTIDPVTGQFATGRLPTETLSTSWWVDYSNFFQSIGALGGGNVSLQAGGSISNMDAVAPTNLRSTKGTVANPLAANQTTLELGGGDVTVRSGGNIDAGVYYVERGQGILSAGGSILTNPTRTVLAPLSITAESLSPYTELPTTFFAGRADYAISARGDLLIGPVANPFLLPSGFGNSIYYKSYFQTYGSDSKVSLSSLGGNITLRTEAALFTQNAAGDASPLLYLWAQNKQLLQTNSAAFSKPWLRLNESGTDNINRYQESLVTLQPGTLSAAAFSGDINLAGNLTLSPSPTGGLSLLASGAINGLQPTGEVRLDGLRASWGNSTINVSDANPLALPGVLTPLGYTSQQASSLALLPDFFSGVDVLFQETGSTVGVIQTKQALHAPGLLHAADPEPVRLYADTGDISGLTLFSPKAARVFAGRDLTDTSLYLQNTGEDEVSIVTSGRDLIPANASSALRLAATRPGNTPNSSSVPLAGDIQISGPGSLQVLAGRTLDLGTVASRADGTGTGLTSIGNARNPYLDFTGAHITAAAGLGASTGLGGSSLDFDSFIATYVKAGQGPTHLTELGESLGGRAFEELAPEEQKRVALEVFFLTLRDAGRGNSGSSVTGGGGGGGYAEGFAAISSLFPQAGTGDILTRGRDIRTRSGGNINLLAPGGGVTLANTIIGNPLAPPGIVTESGGNISIFANNDVSVGVGRIFTLRGGNQIIWSSTGDIAAGSAPKTVQSAPPTRVLIDPQSGAVQTDLAGLATGGGIGVLATVAGVEPGNVDLIAPVGVVDAGDAGIRSSGNLTIAATQVLNAGNISVTGSSAGTPTTVVTTPNVGGLTAAGNAGAATNQAAQATAKAASTPAGPAPQALPSIITVEVLGYGGGEGAASGPPNNNEDLDEEERRRRALEAAEGGESPSAVSVPGVDGR